MSTINILLQSPQYYGILRKPHADGEFEVYRGFVWVNVGGRLRGLFYAVPDFSTPPPRFLAKARTGASVEMTVVEVAA